MNVGLATGPDRRRHARAPRSGVLRGGPRRRRRRLRHPDLRVGDRRRGRRGDAVGVPAPHPQAAGLRRVGLRRGDLAHHRGVHVRRWGSRRCSSASWAWAPGRCTCSASRCCTRTWTTSCAAGSSARSTRWCGSACCSPSRWARSCPASSELSEGCSRSEITVAGVSIVVPGVRLTLWLAGLIIVGAGVLATVSLRSAADVAPAPRTATALDELLLQEGAELVSGMTGPFTEVRRSHDQDEAATIRAKVKGALPRASTERGRRRVTGHFIAFEGGEGSGKSTQARRLAERLGPPALLTFEPGDSPLGTEVRRLVLDSPDLEITRPGRGAAHGRRPRPARRGGDRAGARRRAHGDLRPLRRLVGRLPGPRPPAPRRRGRAAVAVGDPGPLARPRGAARGEPRSRRVTSRAGAETASSRPARRSTAACTTASSCRPWRIPTAGRSSTAPAARTRSPTPSGRS